VSLDGDGGVLDLAFRRDGRGRSALRDRRQRFPPAGPRSVMTAFGVVHGACYAPIA
jgi:hypothetical protein